MKARRALSMTRYLAALVSFAGLGFAVAGLPSCGAGGGRTHPDAGGGGGPPMPDLVEEFDSTIPCTQLSCQVVDCNGGNTVLTGKVFDPAGDLPLYNAMVYIPNDKLEPFKPGVTCDQCGTKVSGGPIVYALTGPDGVFKLNNPPSGDTIPLVMQIGRWRRKVIIPHIEPCVLNTLNDPKLLHLPRSKAEGDIPQMAIASGDADPFECLLRKIGIDDSEFTQGPGTKGRVHFYVENGRNMSPSAPPASMLWSDIKTLKTYDIVMLPCEGSDRSKPLMGMQNLIDYADAGGRVFTTHYGYTWIYHAPAPWPTTGDWQPGGSIPNDMLDGLIDTGFPKGKSFAKWLMNVGASTQEGHVLLLEPRHDINDVNKAKVQRWIYGTGMAGKQTIQTFAFNTPMNPPPPPPDAGELMDGVQCGRVVYTDFHVSVQALSGSTYFPASCKTAPLSAQEKALAFMLFDLSACVQKDGEPPIF